MSENNLIPISDDQAKALKAAIDAAKATGGYLGDILGDLPRDLVGLLIGDKVKVVRAERLAKLWDGARERLANRGVKEPESPSLKLALPILEAAADENREELQDLWERLLAAAMDPSRQTAFRQQFISVVKEMDPFDARVFQVIVDSGGSEWMPNGRDAISSRLRASRDEVVVSFDNLKRLDCIRFPNVAGPSVNPVLSPLGWLLANAIA